MVHGHMKVIFPVILPKHERKKTEHSKNSELQQK